MERLPPGQRWISKPVVYDIVDSIPSWDMQSYRFELFGLVEKQLSFSYSELLELSSDEIIADFHCVTRWSVKDIHWRGVKTLRLLSMAKPLPEAKFVFVRSLEGYTTNMPVEYLEDGILATYMNGDILPKEHGFPLRLVVPRLYAWKSAKYVKSIELIANDQAGFWEQRGYNMRGDPWKEERYW
ncbi:MAG: sulfite oxidase-like oxidoreductase [Aquificaceae bacterium]|nr:sulfite oxidase-like oxidoreductase [Aquificaceae bacterium]MDW8237131.1 sulfite oxidase-like oxidoreductase [Aquificaceae bacterium]